MESRSGHLGIDSSGRPGKVDTQALRQAFELMDLAAQYTVSDGRSSLNVNSPFIRSVYKGLGMEIPQEVELMLNDPQRDIALAVGSPLRGSHRGSQRIMSVEDRARTIIGAVNRVALIPMKD